MDGREMERKRVCTWIEAPELRLLLGICPSDSKTMCYDIFCVGVTAVWPRCLCDSQPGQVLGLVGETMRFCQVHGQAFCFITQVFRFR